MELLHEWEGVETEVGPPLLRASSKRGRKVEEG
jgi:hypothetical protein